MSTTHDFTMPEKIRETITAADAPTLHILDAGDATHRIGQISEWNGPSGWFLGKRIAQEQVKKGRYFRDWTIREADAFCELVRAEYNDHVRRIDVILAAPGQ